MTRLSKPRKKRTIYIKTELHQWIEKQTEKGRFQNFGHAIEVALEKLGDAKE
jgi:Arc/MetJ-type ribon-helix-helix transcriptional regulator